MLKILYILILNILLTGIVYAQQNVFINEAGLYPEGISYDKNTKHFFVSSVAKGEIWTVDEDGKSSLFATDSRFPSTLGLIVNQSKNQLLVCVGDPGVGNKSKASTKGKLTALAIYNLNTKKIFKYYNLNFKNDKRAHISNDVTFDNMGNIYVTDSFSPRIYKVDTKGSISIFAKDIKWEIEPGSLGLNGIVYHPNGYLIVSNYTEHTLYKINIENPSVHTKIDFPIKNLNIDGLNLLNNTTLALVSNSFDKNGKINGVYKLYSSDNWNHAHMIANMQTSTTFPTALTQKDSELYVLHSKLPTLFGGNKVPESVFEIQKVIFEKNK